MLVLNLMKTAISKITPYKYLIPAAFIVAAFVGGWQLKGVFVDAAQVNQVKIVYKERVVQDKRDRESVQDLQQNLDVLRNSYATLGKELTRVKKNKVGQCSKNDGSSFILNNDAIRLWDNIGYGGYGETSEEGRLPTDTAGTSQTATRVSEPVREIVVEDLFDNHKVNAENFNAMRKQIEAIIKWDKDTYGK